METKFGVPDASCQHCKATIESAVSALSGIREVQLDLSTNRLLVEHDGSVQSEDVAEAIQSAGYTPEPVS